MPNGAGLQTKELAIPPIISEPGPLTFSPDALRKSQWLVMFKSNLQDLRSDRILPTSACKQKTQTAACVTPDSTVRC
jgi:hypothetical protein